jgi:hypothetical protein
MEKRNKVPVRPLSERINLQKAKLEGLEATSKYRHMLVLLHDKNLTIVDRVESVKEFLTDEILSENEPTEDILNSGN